MRWAYGDSSLRSHFLTEFNLESVRRGPVYFLELSNDTLRDRTRKPTFYKEMTISMVLVDKFDAALAALEVDARRDPDDRITKYWLGLVRCARGDSTGVAELFQQAGLNPRRGLVPEIALARARLAAGDTTGARDLALRAVTHAALEPEAHGVLADAMLRELSQNATVAMEALAHRALAPANPIAWRRWAYVQAVSRSFVEAYGSIQHYFAIGGRAAEADSAAQTWRNALRRLQPGSELSQQALRAPPAAKR